MKKIKMKVFRMITCLTLLASLSLVSAFPTYAAGPETWSQDRGPTEEMRVVNNNLTPIKTMGRSGTLRVYFNVIACRQGFCDCVDREPLGYSAVRVTMQIRRAGSSQVLTSASKIEGVFYNYVDLYVTQGERIQLFTDVSSYGPSPGVNRRGHVSYYYQFI